MTRVAYYARLYFTQGARLLWRNRPWSLTALGVIAAALIMLYVIAAVGEHTRQAARKVDDRLVVTAVIAQADTCRAEPGPQTCHSVVPAAGLADQVRAMPEVESVHVVTQEEARERLMQTVYAGKKDQQAAESRPAAWVFKEMLEISTRETRDMQAVRDRVADMNGVEDAYYLGDLVKKLTAYSDYQKSIAIGLLGLIAVFALATTGMVVRMSLHSQRRSVDTMSAVGGSVWTIATPIMVQMAVVCAAASLVACAAGYVIDPHLGTSFGQGADALPEWLQVGRAFPLMAPLPLLFAVSVVPTCMVVAWGAWRHAR